MLGKGGADEAKARGKLVARSKEAVPLVRLALTDPAPAVKRSAIDFLMKVDPPVPDLCGNLVPLVKDADEATRLAAVTALGERGKELRAEVLPALLPLLADPGEPTAKAAKEALNKIGNPTREDLPILQKLVARALIADRRRIVASLRRLGPDSPVRVPLLLPLLGDSAREIRVAAAEGLGELGQAAGADAYAALLKVLLTCRAEDANTLIVALEKVGQPGPNDRTQLLTIAEEGTLPDSARAYALKALGRLGGGDRAKLAPLLLRLARGSSPMLGKAAVETLLRLGPPPLEDMPTMIAALRDTAEPEALRLYAAGSLAGLGPAARDAGPVLAACLRDKNPAIRKKAAEALGKIKPRNRAIVVALTGALEDPDRELRVFAVAALGELHTVSGAFEGLLRALQDEDPEVIRKAGAGLERLGKPVKANVPLLAVALQARQAHVRGYAAHALGLMGEDAAEAIPELTRAIKDATPAVARSALLAIRNLGPAASSAAPALVERLDTKDETIRLEVACALLSLGKAPDRAMPVLVAALKADPPPAVVTDTLDRITTYSGEVAHALVLGLAEPLARDALTKVLLRMGNKCVPELIAVLRSKDEGVRLSAVLVLGRIGQPAFVSGFRAVGQLARIDPSDQVRKAAREAMKLMQPKKK
jgi:HEAT repeat protein